MSPTVRRRVASASAFSRVTTASTELNESGEFSPDGERFPMVKEVEAPTTEPVVVLNWHEELKRLIPRRPVNDSGR
jgi:hypothetical protein